MCGPGPAGAGVTHAVQAVCRRSATVVAPGAPGRATSSLGHAGGAAAFHTGVCMASRQSGKRSAATGTLAQPRLPLQPVAGNLGPQFSAICQHMPECTHPPPETTKPEPPGKLSGSLVPANCVGVADMYLPSFTAPRPGLQGRRRGVFTVPGQHHHGWQDAGGPLCGVAGADGDVPAVWREVVV